jgi:hypothetical protein
MSNATEELPDDLASALALLAQERARRVAAEAEAAIAKAEAASAKALVSHSEALIARLKLEIDKFAVNSTAAGPSVRRGSLSRWNCSSKNSKQMPAKTNWPRRS